MSYKVKYGKRGKWRIRHEWPKTGIATETYRENWERIFRKGDTDEKVENDTNDKEIV